jgi:TetR/AcrR family transcriptional regulator, repressor for neighboring sulfatase
MARSRKAALEKRAPRTTPRVRKRRAPEQARSELIAAAERLLSEHGPDAVGLRDVARVAGVSHGLITHYFKTYEGLVEAVFAQRAERITSDVVARLSAAETAPSAAELVRWLLATVSEPVHLRLVAWAVLSGRSRRVDFLPGRVLGLRAISDAIRQAAVLEAERRRSRPPSQDDVDYALMLALGATYGYGLGKLPFLSALGRKPSQRTDDEVMSRLTAMVQALLTPGPAARG